jgi:hypothetical protein
MSKHVHSFSERHPDMGEKIKKVSGGSTAFGDICSRFDRLWDRLNELENETVDTEQLRKEVLHLEREMLAMVHDQMRV